MANSKDSNSRVFKIWIIASWYFSNISVLFLNKYLLTNSGFKRPIFLTMCHMMTACSLLSHVAIMWMKWECVAAILAALLHPGGRRDLAFLHRVVRIFGDCKAGGLDHLCHSHPCHHRHGHGQWGRTEPSSPWIYFLRGCDCCKSIQVGASRNFAVVRGGDNEFHESPFLHGTNISCYYFLQLLGGRKMRWASYWLLQEKISESSGTCSSIQPTFFFFINLVNFLVTKHTSPLTLQVLGNATGVMAAVLTICIFKNQTTVKGFLGHVLTVIGAVLYHEAKRRHERSSNIG
ncbi:hypothetical protein AAC387_Pa05g3614 [Persea americana]